MARGCALEEGSIEVCPTGHIPAVSGNYPKLPKYKKWHKNVFAKKLGEKSLAEIEHNAMEKLRILGIDQLAKKRASRISGGEKQRVAIARALINNPSIIMGDEPTGNLDSYNSDNVFNIFKQLSDEQGLSLLVVTHDIDFANKTNRIIQMGDGRIID